MYAYIDETGNTGQNLFDPAQPVFMTGALISKADFNLIHGQQIRMLAKELGAKELHGNELGIAKIETIAPELLKILTAADTLFSISRIDKAYLAVAKMVDTIFDAGENLAVPWLVYNARPLRLLLVFKVAHLLDQELVGSFWSSLMEPKEDRATKRFVDVLETLLARVPALPDQGSRERVTEAVKWAIENPEAISLHTYAKSARSGHLPNMAAFPGLLDGIESASELWELPVKEIWHDRQSQFEPTLKEWHELFANVEADPIDLPGGERYVFNRVFGSKFIMSRSQQSEGIQVIDTVLWLYKQMHDGKQMGPKCVSLMDWVIGRGELRDLSFEGVSNYLEGAIDQLFSTPVTSKQMKDAKKLYAMGERRRHERMLVYAQQKLEGSSPVNLPVVL